ncbi:MAG: GreA/GreB family elongation factor [Acidobacteriota bacterium]
MAEHDWRDEWDELLIAGESGALEEFWLARLEQGVGDPAPYLEALKGLRSASKRALAGTLLELAADQALADGSWAARRAFLRELLRLGVGDEKAWRAGLEACVRHLWAGRPSLDRLLSHFRLTEARKPLEVLDQLESWLEFDVGGVFLMAGKGPGRVVETNPQLGMLRLDLEREKRVPVPIDAARKYLAPLPAGHFLRRRLEEPSRLAGEVVADPPGAVVAILESCGAMTVSELKAALAGVLPDDQWTSWWNKAKKQPRLIASGSGTRVQYRLEAGQGAEAEIRREFEAASLAQRVALARRHGGRERDLGTWMATLLLAGAEHATADAGTAWEALTQAGRFGAPATAVERARAAIIDHLGPIPLLQAVSDATQREALLDVIRETRPDGWGEVYTGWLAQETHPRLLTVLSAALVAANESTKVVTFLDQVFLSPQRFPAAYVWVFELTEESELTALVDERRSGALLVRLVELAERKEFASLRTRIKDVISPRGLAARIVAEKLSIDQARRLVQILEAPGELPDERNWLRRAALARFPELRQAPQLDVVPALPGTVARLQQELRALLEREIPETLKAIQVAKEHGDLRENFEYHAARARQEFLSARAARLQEDLAKVRVIEPASVDTSRVRVGTRAWLEPLESGERRGVIILGPYEGDPERGILSHETEAALALLDREPGDRVTFDGREWTVAAVEPASE